jgi:hypothetical protein
VGSAPRCSDINGFNTVSSGDRDATDVSVKLPCTDLGAVKFLNCHRTCHSPASPLTELVEGTR